MYDSTGAVATSGALYGIIAERPFTQLASLVEEGDWRVASSTGASYRGIHKDGWRGITRQGTMACAAAINVAGTFTSEECIDDMYCILPGIKEKAILSMSSKGDGYWYVATDDGRLSYEQLLGECRVNPTKPAYLDFAVRAKASCVLWNGACILSIYGTVHCSGHGYTSLGVLDTTEPVVEIVCGPNFVCALTSSGLVQCSPGAPQPPGDVAAWRNLGSPGPYDNKVCGITAANELRCWGPNYSQVLGPGNSWGMVAVSRELICSVATD